MRSSIQLKIELQKQVGKSVIVAWKLNAEATVAIMQMTDMIFTNATMLITNTLQTMFFLLDVREMNF